MNNFDTLSAIPDAAGKLRTASTIHQLTAREALFSAALDGGLNSVLQSHRPSTQGMLGCNGAPLNSLQRPSLLDIRDVWSTAANPFATTATGGNPLLSRTPRSTSSAAATASAALSLTADPRLLDAAIERRRLDLEHVKAIRQQALALTEESPFQTSRVAPSDSLRALLHQGALEQQRQQEVGQQQKQQQHFAAVASSSSVMLPQGNLNTDGTLAALGSSMRKKNSPYIDASSLSDPDPTDLARRRTRGGVTEPFPEKLHRMLREVAEAGDSDIISFFAHGRAFGVHDPERFVSKVMPKYFKQSRLSSFQRQLNLYGFTRISSGPDTGGYYHELFLEGRAALCVHMRRVGVPHGEDRRKLKAGAKKTEPDFYAMKSVTASQQQQPVSR